MQLFFAFAVILGVSLSKLVPQTGSEKNSLVLSDSVLGTGPCCFWSRRLFHAGNGNNRVSNKSQRGN